MNSPRSIRLAAGANRLRSGGSPFKRSSAELARDVILGALPPGRFEHLRRRARLDHFAEIEKRHLIGAAPRLFHIVRDDQDREVQLQLADQSLDFLRAQRIERAGRLIEKDYLRPRRKRAGDAKTLLLAERN